VTTNLELARSVAMHVQLFTIALRKANVVSLINPFDQIPELAFNQQHRASYVRSDSDPERLEVVLDFGFRALDERDAEAPSEVVKLQATFALQYMLPRDMSFEAEALRQFAWLNGAYNAWPYWREFVQSVTGRIGLNGLTPPVFRPKVEQIPDSNRQNDPEGSSDGTVEGSAED
jgi:hypothetical protein